MLLEHCSLQQNARTWQIVGRKEIDIVPMEFSLISLQRELIKLQGIDPKHKLLER
jgi:hypothetical protein